MLNDSKKEIYVKKLLICFLFLAACSPDKPKLGTLHDGPYLIQNSDDLAYMDPVSWVTGDLSISAHGVPTISLPNLRGVGGALYISSTNKLTALRLPKLTSVGGLFIEYNDALTSVTGLDGLITVGWSLIIDRNPTLKSLDGLSGIASLGGALHVYGNDTLSDLAGLSGLARVDGDLTIQDNSVMTSLGLTALTGDVKGFFIYDNPELCQSRVTILQEQVSYGNFRVKDNKDGC